MAAGKGKRTRKSKTEQKKIASTPIAKNANGGHQRARPGDFDKQVKKIRRDMASVRANLEVAQQILNRHDTEEGATSDTEKPGARDEPMHTDLKEDKYTEEMQQTADPSRPLQGVEPLRDEGKPDLGDVTAGIFDQGNQKQPDLKLT